LLHYAFLLWRSGDHERADAAIVGAVRSQPAESAILEAVLAEYYGLTGRPAEGVAPARRASELAPDEPRMAARYVTALSRAGDRPGAVQAAERATARFPKEPSVWGGLAVAAAQAHQDEVARRAFGKWLELAPNDPDARANYGYFLHQSGLTRDARAVLEEATRQFPGHGTGWRNYAVVLEALGEASAAAEARKKADALMSDREKNLLLH